MNNLRAILLTAVFLYVSFQSIGQPPATFDDTEVRFAHAMELYDKEKYAAAQVEFQQLQKDINDPYRELSVDAEFYAARCAIKLFHKDTRERLVHFVHDHPESQWVRTAYFELANYYYSRKRYRDALEWFARVKETDLDLEERNDFYFRRGYAAFRKEQYGQARTDFAKLIQVENRYYAPSNYYHAHLAYQDGNYETALEGFERLKDQAAFQSVIPYYITQIYFIQKRYDEVVAYGPGVLDSVKVKKADEVSRIVGESYYNLQRYEEAVPYLETFKNGPSPKERQDHYQLGYAYFKSGRHEEAISSFNLLTNVDDELTQTATYHIGESYLALEQKTYARNAFKESARYDFDQELQEDALFSYAKLAYELSADPFNEAILAFERYLEEYPTSSRRDEAYEFLLDVYLTTNNYAAALDALDKIEEKDLKAQTAYQLSAYNRAVELFLNRKFDLAGEHLELVERYPVDASLIAMAHYWKAEILYQDGAYDDAILAYRDFQARPQSSSTPYYQEAYYSTAYAYFAQKEYPNAMSTFTQYLSDTEGVAERKQNDALLRMGDCAFVAKDYDQAIRYYGQAKDIGALNADYALFQMARSQGFQNKPEAKAESLRRLLADYSNSSYLVSSKYQLADTYFKQDKDAQALELFQEIINTHQGSPYVKKSLLSSGLIHYRMKDYEAAIEEFKRVVEDYPSDADSQEAQLRIQDVYVELGRMDEFNAWYEEYVPTGSVAEQDSVNYRFAENLYIAGDCDQAIDAFVDYIARFQPGIFGVNASFYLGECLYQQEEKEIAYNNYLYVIEQPVNDFTEPALFAAATIAYEQERYEEALQHYTDLERTAIFDENILEARIGQMRCHFQLGNKEETLTYSDVVIADDNSPEYITKEAYFFKAKTLLFLERTDEALVAFSWVDKESTGNMGAESRFNIARIHYNEESYDIAEEDVFSLIEDYPSQTFWKIKAFMLLADVYVAKEDYFQAKTTLQSIMDNVDDESVQSEAMEKFQAILEIEAQESEGVEEEMEIEYETVDPSDDGSQFDEEESE